MNIRKEKNKTSHQYIWAELCKDETELKKIQNLPEIERERLYDERVDE